MAIDAHGNVYVEDTGNDRIVVFSPSGTVRAIIDGNPQHYGCDDTIDGVHVDDAGRIYTRASGACGRPDGGSTTVHDRTMELSPHGKLLHVWTGRQPSFAPIVGPDLYVCGHGGPSLSHTHVHVILATACEDSGFYDETNNLHPILAIDRQGNLYSTWNEGWTRSDFTGLSGPVDAAVAKFSPRGTLLRQYGVYDSSAHPGGRMVSPYQFTVPDALAVDASGKIYVGNHGKDYVSAENSGTEPYGGRGEVVVLSPSGKTLDTWRGLQAPVSITVDGNRHVYVLDTALGCVLQYSVRGMQKGRWCSS